jgi:hypothetical protein
MTISTIPPSVYNQDPSTIPNIINTQAAAKNMTSTALRILLAGVSQSGNKLAMNNTKDPNTTCSNDTVRE